ncbi:hypothetical protein WJX75_002546 [Coccomyxa subellipsoidea]|uniref:FAD/NAD(P)-binding domain-containing protein n=1 Tax=Coccomyxa subellipsoidea TaxID=248742 RepID=A0ABR2YQA2_9CHLO
MLAAAAVSPFVDEVVLLDKETSLGRSGSEGELHERFTAAGCDLAQRARMRKGVPQYIQSHGLLCRGAVEMLLPGWHKFIEGLGGVTTTPGRWKTFSKGQWMHYPEDPSGLFTLPCCGAPIAAAWKDGYAKDWDGIYICATAPVTRGGLVQKIETGILLCGVFGYSKDQPPHDEQGFTEFVASLEVNDVYEAIKDAETLREPVSYSGMTNLRRLYEDIPMPGGLAVVGDSLAGFNPVYGQGISVAAMEAEALRKLLQEKLTEAGSVRVTAADLGSLAVQYQAKAKHIVDFPFSLSSGMYSLMDP